MKILITGGSGFVGGAFFAVNRDRFDIERFSFRQGWDTLSMDGIDAVVHFAAVVHQMNGAPEGLYEAVNVSKTVALAAKAKAAGVKQFVFMSSIKACGEESEAPYTERTDCFPQDAYGKSKWDAERQLAELQDETFKIAIVRAPLVYGEGVKANMLNFIKLVDRFPVLPFGAIRNKRSMVYVGNLVYLIGEIVVQKQSGIFLAADGAPVSTTELAENVAGALEKKIRLISLPFFARLIRLVKPGLYRRLYKSLYVDNTLTVTTLRLENPYTFHEGICKTVEFYRAKRQLEV